MADNIRRVYFFGSFRLDVTDRLLYRDDQLVALAPKVFDTLLLLVAGEGRVVTKAELMKQLWPDTFVEEGTLAQYVSVLRKTLGEGGKWIENLPRRGYRFNQPVEEFPNHPAELVADLVIEEHTRSRTVIEEEILVEGKQANDWRAVAAVCTVLVLAGTFAFVWLKAPRRDPRTFPSSEGDSQGRLALAQHNSYREGRVGPEFLRAAISNANNALVMNANSPAAVRAIVHIQHSTGRQVEGLQLARRALDENPGNLDAIEAAAEAYFRTGLHDRAADLYAKALALEPGNGAFRRQLGRIYLFEGEYQKGIDALSPLPLNEVGPFGMALFAEAGQRDQAIEAAKLYYHGYFSAYFGGCVLAGAGDPAGAKALWVEGMKVAESLLERNENPHTRVFLGMIYAKLGMKDLALEQVERSLRPDTRHPTFLYFSAKVHALLGNRREALEYLRASMENGFLNLPMLDYHQRPTMAFYTLRNDRELRAIRAEMAHRVDELRARY